MDDKPLKLKMTQDQHIYGWMIKQGLIKTFDLSWPCITARKIVATDDEIIAHNAVVAIFRRMGVR